VCMYLYVRKYVCVYVNMYVSSSVGRGLLLNGVNTLSASLHAYLAIHYRPAAASDWFHQQPIR